MQAPICTRVGFGAQAGFRSKSTAWNQGDVFPMIAAIIQQLFEQHQRFIIAREICAQLLLNDERSRFVAAAREARKNQNSVEWVASNMAAWFSARITRGDTEWEGAFERTTIDGDGPTSP